MLTETTTATETNALRMVAAYLLNERDRTSAGQIADVAISDELRERCDLRPLVRELAYLAAYHMDLEYMNYESDPRPYVLERIAAGLDSIEAQRHAAFMRALGLQ